MIYLDAAATTFQKPPEVRMAVERAFRSMTTPGRGGYPEAELAAKTVFDCRSEAAALFHVPTEEQVVFTSNATHALNIAIKTLVHPGDTVLVSGYEHNAVMRPLYGMKHVRVQVASGPLFDQQAILDSFRQQLGPGIKAVICTHVSNVFGMILPIEEISALCREKGVPLIVDASQSAGILPVDLQAWGAAFVAMPGHKGLYGPQGTGILLCAHDAMPLIEGGTGSMSILKTMPPDLPDRLEAGTQNVPGIAGLLEGLRFVRRIGVSTVAQHEQRLISAAAQELKVIPGVQVFAGGVGEQSGVLSFRISGKDCEETAAYLARNGVAVRAGLHCAPLAHKTAGTLETGTIRISVSAFNTEQEILRFLQDIHRLTERKR